MSQVRDPTKLCPIACDVAIPLVYPSQPITIPTQAVAAKIPGIAGIDVPASMRATFTDPGSDPPLRIASVVTAGPRVVGLGHAGIAFINGRTGGVRYAEYGRYDRAGFGLVRYVPDFEDLTITFTETGNPDGPSMRALGNLLVRTNGGPYAVEGVWIKLQNGAFGRMFGFVNRRIEAIAARSATQYDVASNHCFTFALQVARSAGVNTNVAGAPALDLELVGGDMVRRSIVRAAAPTFEVPARQVKVMQRRYQPYRLRRTGRFAQAWNFPSRLNGR
ncbi:MAG: hypothetical protein AAFY65_03755 [Pseudomonadota bacterium]